jgi:hypothetical protein
MEDHLAQTIMNDAEMQAFFQAGRDPFDWFYASSSLGNGDNPAVPTKPYVVWNELPAVAYQQVKKLSDAQLRTFNLYVYDEKGDFTRINAMLRVLRRIVKVDLDHFQLEDGTRCSASEWVGISGNIEDDGYDAIVRFGTARFTVNR